MAFILPFKLAKIFNMKNGQFWFESKKMHTVQNFWVWCINFVICWRANGQNFQILNFQLYRSTIPLVVSYVEICVHIEKYLYKSFSLQKLSNEKKTNPNVNEYMIMGLCYSF
jgi:hypothetical protein